MPEISPDSGAVTDVMPSDPGMGAGSFQASTAGVGDADSAIETNDLRAAATSGRDACQKLAELISSMRELVAASESYWTGEAADFFRESVPVGLADFERCLEDLSAYPRELISYADAGDGVITQTEMIADGVEMPVYSEE